MPSNGRDPGRTPREQRGRGLRRFVEPALAAAAVAALHVGAAAQTDTVYVALDLGFAQHAVLQWDGFTQTSVAFSNPGLQIADCDVHDSGKLWIATSEYGYLSKVYGVPPTTVGQPEWAEPIMAVDELAVANGDVYFGGWEPPYNAVIRRWDGLSSTIHFILPGTGSIQGLAADPDDTLWVLLQTTLGGGTVGELYKLPSTSFTPEVTLRSTPGFLFNSFKLRSGGIGGVFLATLGSGPDSFVYFWDGSLLLPVMQLDVPQGNVADFAVTTWGDLWFLVSTPYELQICANSTSNPIWTLTGGQSTTMAMRRPPGDWLNLYNAVPGAAGEPRLFGSGLPFGGSSVALQLSDAPASTIGWLVVGTAASGAEFGGGVLVPQPAFTFPIATTAAGSWDVSSVIPSSVPTGSSFYLQCWFMDPTASQGWAASNALRVETQ
ncbi:MAG TPA: hypothetical protein VFD43_13205 [Planctomycetota bacterium]|nr:hypothetical protein [Planctomycetota bacterium]